jgi:excisionase family DNA binding protein
MLQYATKEDIDRLERKINEMIVLARPAGVGANEERQRWLTTKEVCETLKLSRVSLEKIVRSGKITKYKVAGDKGSNRYDLNEIQLLKVI